MRYYRRIAPGNDVVGDFSAPSSVGLRYLNDFYHGFHFPPSVPSPEVATIVAFVFKEGVMVAVDSRARFGGNLSSECVKKFFEINPHVVGTMSGSAAEWLFWDRNLVINSRRHEFANKTRTSVSKAAKLAENICSSYLGSGLSLATMIAGWDEKGPRLYYVTEVGRSQAASRYCVGSGSPNAHRVLTSSYRYDMSVEEASELARRAIYDATFRDGASGGVASVYVGPNGWKNLSGDDVRMLPELVRNGWKNLFGDDVRMEQEMVPNGDDVRAEQEMVEAAVP